ncbi:helix-turn-helix transcriptional regulator, partial [Amycolatopsis sp. H6(2020)]|nr:helix-turn-helix transcriptional regulator [Amycolatopsis sp. H6(2020)]
MTQEVKAWMGRRGVSARQLAAAIGLSNSPMSKRLRGDTAFTINDLGLIASYFGITLEQLLGEVARKRLIGVGDAESPTSEEVGLRVRTAAAGAGSSAVRPVGL